MLADAVADVRVANQEHILNRMQDHVEQLMEKTQTNEKGLAQSLELLDSRVGARQGGAPAVSRHLMEPRFIGISIRFAYFRLGAISSQPCCVSFCGARGVCVRGCMHVSMAV